MWGAEPFFDGTKGRATADYDSLLPRWSVATKEHLATLFADDVDGAPAPPPDTGAAEPPVRLPFVGTADAEEQRAARNAARWRVLDERRLNPDRPPSGPDRRITDVRVSTTDPDAAPLRTSAPPRLGYHDHSVVDGGRARIILAALVTPADVQDNQALLDRLDRVRFRSHLHVHQVVADSKYATGENLRRLAERGIRASMPVVDHEQSTAFFRHQDFVYNPQTDTYRCPQEATLTFRGNHYVSRVHSYAAPPLACAGCPLRARCTESSTGRRLNRPFDEWYGEQVRALAGTEVFKQALRKRRVWVEPLFGEAKDWHGLRRFRLRGLWKVNWEGLLIAAGQNLKRWLTGTGWGRRHGPTGSLALSRPRCSSATATVII